MQLRLDLQYPPLSRQQARHCSGPPVFTSAPPGIPASASLTHWPPSPCGRLSRPRTTTRPPPRPRPPAGSGPAPVPAWQARQGATPDGSHVHHAPIGGPGAQLVSRQHRHDYAADLHHGLPASAINWLRSRPPHAKQQPRTAHRPLSARFEPAHRLRGVTTGSSPAPSRHAHQTRPVWQYQAVLTLSGLLPALTGVPGSDCPQLHQAAATT